MTDTLDFHPLADLFPLMQGEEFAALVADIKTRGLLHPIAIRDLKILDGRNRHRACVEAGVTIRTIEYQGDDPVGYVVAANLHRRHLDESQRAMVAIKLATMRQGERTDLASIDATSQSDAARLLNVGRASVQRARKVRRKGTPKLVAAVERGEIPVSVAAQAAELSPEQQDQIASKPATAKHAVKKTRRANKEAALAVATTIVAAELGRDIYGVIYADPPWRFEPYSRDTGMDRAADNHYPTMTLDSIKSLVVPAAPDCVLFLWATVPMLADAIDVLRAWGFIYRSNFAWIKDRAGTGYWNRNRHELLLIGTRGNIPAPAPGEQYESAIAASVGQHSVKPFHFREIIEDMFPTLPRVELFHRGDSSTGWDVWGNEVSKAA